jgi:diguanylate cyclase (GGDEF)-like protein
MNSSVVEKLAEIKSYRYNDPKRAVEELKLLSKQEDLSGQFLFDLYVLLAHALNEVNDTIESGRYLMKATDLLHFNEKPDLEVSLYSGYAIRQQILGDMELAIDFYQKAFYKADETGDIKAKASVLVNIGTIYEEDNQLKKAVDHFEQGLELARKIDEEIIILISLINIATLCNKQQQSNKALAAAEEGEKIALKLKMEYYLPALYMEQGRAHLHLNCIDLSHEFMMKGLELGNKIDDPHFLIDGHTAMAEYFHTTEQSSEAIQHLDIAIQIGKEHGMKFLTVLAYEKLFEIYKSRAEFDKALDTYIICNNLRKEMQQEKYRQKLQVMEMKNLSSANDRIKTISSIGKQITSELEIGKTLDILNMRLNMLMDAYIFGIASLKDGYLNYDKFLKNGKSTPERRHMLSDTKVLGSLCARERREIIIQNTEKEIADFGLVYDELDPIRSILFTPLVVNDSVIGVMTVQSKKINAYSIDQIDIFQALSGFVAIALNNATQAKIILKQNEELKIHAQLDPLTAISNRRYFMQEFEKVWALSKRSQNSISMLLLDLDYFKQINDTHGHLAGDYCLKETAEILKQQLHRDTDIFGRFGGEEFIVLLPTTEPEEVIAIAEQLRTSIESHIFDFEGTKLQITISIGAVSAVPEISDKPESLLDRADKALYKAKNSGRNRTEC